MATGDKTYEVTGIDATQSDGTLLDTTTVNNGEQWYIEKLVVVLDNIEGDSLSNSAGIRLKTEHDNASGTALKQIGSVLVNPNAFGDARQVGNVDTYVTDFESIKTELEQTGSVTSGTYDVLVVARQVI